MRYTGAGMGTKWPHPNNDDFNQVIRSAVKDLWYRSKEGQGSTAASQELPSLQD